ncbi:MAG: glycosyltransferase family 4 protein [Lachnospiraceae bacterium]|nr:glycosyltransferase family 4 protein [Lachnospiraceae bacterium]
MIGHKRIPSREGGVERVVEELALRMAEKGHEVCVYNRKGHHVSGKENDMKKQKAYKGVRIITVPTVEKKSLNAVVYAFFATIHALFGHYDVIHFHAEGPCAFLWLPRLFCIRTVATIHGLDWQRAKWGGFATRFLKYGEKTAAKYADEVIVLSPETQRYFKQTYNRETVYIPNGVDKAVMQKPKVIKEKYGLSGNDYLLFLARIVPEKGLHYLIEAYKKSGCAKKLVIAGGSSHSDDYFEEIQKSCEGKHDIIFTGFVQGRELEELYSNCYLYILPSDVEGMPISLLEAMSYGAQCLVSDIAENMGVAGAYASVFAKSNVEDLEKKLCGLTAGGYSFAHTKQEIAEYITEKYKWDEIVEETLKLYQGSKHENINGK